MFEEASKEQEVIAQSKQATDWLTDWVDWAAESSWFSLEQQDEIREAQEAPVFKVYVCVFHTVWLYQKQW